MASPKDLGCRIACWDPAPNPTPPHPSPSSGPLRLKGELCCPNSPRNRVGTVYSLTLNKEGTLTGSALLSPAA